MFFVDYNKKYSSSLLKSFAASAFVCVSGAGAVEAAGPSVEAIDVPAVVTVGQTFVVKTTIESTGVGGSASLEFHEFPAPGNKLISFVSHVNTTGGLAAPTYSSFPALGLLQWSVTLAAGSVYSYDLFQADTVGLELFVGSVSGTGAPETEVVEIVPIPEPGTYAVLGSFLGIAMLRRRKSFDESVAASTQISAH